MPTPKTILKQFRSGWRALLVPSLLLNAVLGYCVLMPQEKAQPQAAARPAAKPLAAKAAARAFPSATPFHWSQLDTPDFPTYAKKLREIGCPEATIRDILAGELDEVYRQKEAQGAMQGGKSSGMMTSAERMRQQNERDQVLAQVMQASAEKMTPAFTQMQTRGGGGTAAASGVTTNGSAAAARAPTVIPAAFAYGAPAGATSQQGGQSVLTAAAGQSQLPPNTAASLQQMQDEFARALGATTQSPNSPEYQDTWNQATRKSDDHFSSLFGGDVFVRTQMDAVRAAAANAANAKR